MRIILATAIVGAMALPLLPAAAQELSPDPAPETLPEAEDRGFSLLEEGGKLMLRGLMQEMEPAIGEMGKALTEIEPALRDMARLIDDIRNYDAPRMLPNGDILIPRRPGSPPPPVFPEGSVPGEPGPGEIEL